MIILPIVSLLLLVLIVINTMRIKALKAENKRLKEYENEARQMRAEYEEKARKLVGVEARKSRVKGKNP